ncbi:MAG TPA: hypothetical protein VF532_08950 [Candidatus Angelobacter sp.]
MPEGLDPLSPELLLPPRFPPRLPPPSLREGVLRGALPPPRISAPREGGGEYLGSFLSAPREGGGEYLGSFLTSGMRGLEEGEGLGSVRTAGVFRGVTIGLSKSSLGLPDGLLA